MVALIFLLVIAAVFASVLAMEGGDEHFERRPAGLLTWIASGNWPAKIGGGLMIIGVGALLRYAVINFDVPDSLKLGVGIAATVVLGLGSQLLSGNPKRRGVSLALGGAAFGVAYLTAYSAFALFGYLPTLQGLGLLALTAVAAGVFAVSRSALSLAVLSMVGAFMAPAFAPQDPGPQVVYGYYVAISLLTLCMVAFRGWRPLIHLSFLFTLAGGAFFAWTGDYFSHAAAPQMLPLIAMLVAVHVAMPLFERRWQRGVIVESLDTIYLLALPLVAALTALVLAPARADLATELWWYAATWFAAAAWLFAQKSEGMATHAVIALLMAGLGLAARFRDLPWELVALAIGDFALALAARRSTSNRLHSFLAGLVLVLAAVHIISALAPAATDTPFMSGRFLERLVGAGLLIIAALTLRRLRHALDGLMLTVAIGWSAFAVGAEVARLDLFSVWLMLHWALVLAAFLLCFPGARVPAAGRLLTPLVFALGLSALLAGMRTHGTLAWISAIVAAAAMLAVALRPKQQEEDGEQSRLLGALGTPIVTALWMACYSPGFAGEEWQFPLAFGAVSAIIVLLTAARAGDRSSNWFNEAADIFAVGFTFVLAAATLFDIARAPAAAMLELICVTGLVLIARWDGKRISIGVWIVPAVVIAIALVLQANLLRWLGPPGRLNALSVARMEWPTLVSLLWASIGAALTISARRAGSRMQWSVGAAFLVGAAIKLVLLDFGSLGQLANILAVIAAGGVFLLVGWLAPMPPVREKPPEARSAPPSPPPPVSAPQSAAPARAQPKRNSTDRLAWTIAIVVFVLFAFTRCGSLLRHPFRFGPFANKIESPGVRWPETDSVPAPAPSAELTSPADSAAAGVSAAEAVPAEAESPASPCVEWVRRLPAGFRPYVVESLEAKASMPVRSVQIDHPGVDVVLILRAPQPTEWKISVMDGSLLAGVWLTSRSQAVLDGVPDDVPVLDAARQSDVCAATSTVMGSYPDVEKIRSVLHASPAGMFAAADQVIRIHDERMVELRSEPDGSIDTEASLQRLLEQGDLRRLSTSEVRALQGMNRGDQSFRVIPDLFVARTGGEPQIRAFMVQRAMELPGGLTGAHAATFVVPSGVPRPSGDPGYSQVIDLNQ